MVSSNLICLRNNKKVTESEFGLRYFLFLAAMIVAAATVADHQNCKNQDDDGQGITIKEIFQTVTHTSSLLPNVRLVHFMSKQKMCYSGNVNIIHVNNVKQITLFTFSTDFSTGLKSLSVNKFRDFCRFLHNPLLLVLFFKNISFSLHKVHFDRHRGFSIL